MKLILNPWTHKEVIYLLQQFKDKKYGENGLFVMIQKLRKKIILKKEKRKRKHDWSKKLFIQRFSVSSYPVSWTEFVDRCCKATFISVTILRNIIMADLSDSVAPNACFRCDTLCWVIKLLGTQRKEEQRKGEPYDWRRRVVNVVEFQCYKWPCPLHACFLMVNGRRKKKWKKNVMEKELVIPFLV